MVMSTEDAIAAEGVIPAQAGIQKVGEVHIAWDSACAGTSLDSCFRRQWHSRSLQSA